MNQYIPSQKPLIKKYLQPCFSPRASLIYIFLIHNISSRQISPTAMTDIVTSMDCFSSKDTITWKKIIQCNRYTVHLSVNQSWDDLWAILNFSSFYSTNKLFIYLKTGNKLFMNLRAQIDTNYCSIWKYLHWIDPLTINSKKFLRWTLKYLLTLYKLLKYWKF